MLGIVRSTTPAAAGLRVVTPNPGTPTIVHRPATSSNVGTPTSTQTTTRVVTVSVFFPFLIDSMQMRKWKILFFFSFFL